MKPLYGYGNDAAISAIRGSRELECMAQEVVALHSTASCSPSQLPQAAAPHALPQEFHNIIARAEQQSSKETVLLDVRNYYETRIGRFQKVHRP